MLGFFSFSSFLHHVSFKQEGSELRNAVKRITDKRDSWNKFHATVKRIVPKLWNQRVEKEKSSISDLKKDSLYTASLQWSDRQVDHAVIIYDGWIFDSNFEHALPFKKQSLDLCCSTDEVPESFVRFVQLNTYPHFQDAIKQTKQQKNKPEQEKQKKRKKRRYEEMDIWFQLCNLYETRKRKEKQKILLIKE